MNRASAEVSLSAIADNLKLIKSKTDSQVLAVVKADAYGHGLIQVGKAAADAGAASARSGSIGFVSSIGSIGSIGGAARAVPKACKSSLHCHRVDALREEGGPEGSIIAGRRVGTF